MKIAVSYDNGQIFQHFGHTAEFKFYTVEDGKVTGSQVVPTPSSGHGALTGFLRAQQVDALICGGIGGGARAALDDAGIRLYGGVSGEADRAVEALLAGNLDYNSMTVCGHHAGHVHAHREECGRHEGHVHAHREGCGRHEGHVHAHHERCDHHEGHAHAHHEECGRHEGHVHAHREGCGRHEDHVHAHCEDFGRHEGHVHAHREGCGRHEGHVHAHHEECGRHEGHVHEHH